MSTDTNVLHGFIIVDKTFKAPVSFKNIGIQAQSIFFFKENAIDHIAKLERNVKDFLIVSFRNQEVTSVFTYQADKTKISWDMTLDDDLIELAKTIAYTVIYPAIQEFNPYSDKRLLKHKSLFNVALEIVQQYHDSNSRYLALQGLLQTRNSIYGCTLK